MSSRSITVDLPDSLYEQLKQRAELAHHTIEAELLEMVSTIVPVAGELTLFLKELLAQMQTLDDKNSGEPPGESFLKNQRPSFNPLIINASAKGLPK